MTFLIEKRFPVKVRNLESQVQNIVEKILHGLIKFFFGWKHEVPKEIRRIQKIEWSGAIPSDKDHATRNRYDFKVFFLVFPRLYLYALLLAVLVKFVVRPIVYYQIGYDMHMTDIWDYLDDSEVVNGNTYLLAIEPFIFGVVLLISTRKYQLSDTIVAATLLMIATFTITCNMTVLVGLEICIKGFIVMGIGALYALPFRLGVIYAMLVSVILNIWLEEKWEAFFAFFTFG